MHGNADRTHEIYGQLHILHGQTQIIYISSLYRGIVRLQYDLTGRFRFSTCSKPRDVA